jgi:hypothetical protein
LLQNEITSQDTYCQDDQGSHCPRELMLF